MRNEESDEDQNPNPHLRNVLANDLKVGDYVMLAETPC